jgi:hypothetical protein
MIRVLLAGLVLSLWISSALAQTSEEASKITGFAVLNGLAEQSSKIVGFVVLNGPNEEASKAVGFAVLCTPPGPLACAIPPSAGSGLLLRGVGP